MWWLHWRSHRRPNPANASRGASTQFFAGALCLASPEPEKAWVLTDYFAARCATFQKLVRDRMPGRDGLAINPMMKGLSSTNTRGVGAHANDCHSQRAIILFPSCRCRFLVIEEQTCALLR